MLKKPMMMLYEGGPLSHVGRSALETLLERLH
jgi:hypothetical protein